MPVNTLENYEALSGLKCCEGLTYETTKEPIRSLLGVEMNDEYVVVYLTEGENDEQEKVHYIGEPPASFRVVPLKEEGEWLWVIEKKNGFHAVGSHKSEDIAWNSYYQTLLALEEEGGSINVVSEPTMCKVGKF